MNGAPETCCESCLHLSKQNGELHRENMRLRAALRVVPGAPTEEERLWAIAELNREARELGLDD